jgi:predicted deacylase
MKNQALTVGSITAPLEERRSGYLPVLQRPMSTIALPVGLVNGAGQGPTVCLTAGIHGSEYAGIEAAIRTWNTTDPSRLSGNLIIVPICNVPAFEAIVPYVMPLDNKNLNRTFPGRPDGSASEILAHYLLAEVVSKADFVIDLHGGDLPELLTPFCVFFETENAHVDLESECLARVYNLPWIERLRLDGTTTGVMVGEAARRGIPAIVAEVGGLGTCLERDVQLHLAGIRNVLRYLGMWEGEPEARCEEQTVMTGRFVVTARHGGLFYPQVQPGDKVRDGDVLGEIRDPFGATVEQVRAPANGVVWVLFPSRVVHSGSLLYKGWTTPVN